MWNPSGNEKGNILQKTYKDEFTNFGTIIDCDLYFDKHSGWTVHSNEKVSLETIGNFDFAVDESLDIQAAKLIDEINKFAEQTNVGIHFKMNKNARLGVCDKMLQIEYNKKRGIIKIPRFYLQMCLSTDSVPALLQVHQWSFFTVEHHIVL